MKFIHMADMHFDSAFTNLSDKGNLGEIKRMEQRSVFKKIIDYIKENSIQLLFISGDFFEQAYIRETTIEYINNLFKEIPETRVFISPGNHDPYTKNSFYSLFDWNSNVNIFDSKISKVECGKIDVYGYGFSDFYCEDCGLQNFVIEDKSKINVLVIHGTLDGSEKDEKQYNPISRKNLQEKGFDYIALGHIHKGNYDEENKIVYSGSTVALGFDELGSHGIIEGEIDFNEDNKKIETKIKFIPIEQTKFEELEIDCSEIISKEELIEKINNIKLEENKLYKIILNGKRNFEIDKYDLYKFNLDEKIIKIKNNTKINYNLNNLINENTLKGLFTKEILERINKCQDEEEKEILEKAAEIGIDVLE